ncbi:MAG: 2-hydroxyacid dehydrogenase [Planctomycetaceae bacterium]|nr:2-hydroxyacid dehydrogenase [Planctomycetaceae bacterium]
MNDQERLQKFYDTLNKIGGLDISLYDRLMKSLEQAEEPDGFDEDGRLKIAFFDARSYEIDSFDQKNQDRYAIENFEFSLNAHTASSADGFKVVCVFVNDTVDAEVVKLLSKHGVELIALRCAGFNNVDLDACKEHNISVVRVPAYSPHAVAEHTLGLMLMLNRHLHRAYLRNRAGSFVLDGLTGFDMHGKTAGVIGTGKIGRCVIEILCGFGCRVLANDKYPHEEVEQNPNAKYVELEQVLTESDMITLHVPLTDETHHMINKETIESMKDGVMLINTSRGGLVDTRELIEGLKSKKIGSAGLDVYEEEAGIFFHDYSSRIMDDDVLARLMSFSNVVVTSHQAFLTREALANIAETTLENIGEYLDGKRGEDLTNGLA